MVGLPADLRDGYRETLRALTASPLSSDSAGASRQLQEIIVAIRKLPGHERFGFGAKWEQLTGAVETGWPLIYVNPAPWGTLLLTLWASGADGASAEATFIETTGTEVFARLIAGAEADDEVPHENVASYLFGISNSERLPAALDELLPWLGEAIGRSIAELLQARAATGATLVICGPLGAAPLHAACWDTDNGPRCLADGFDIRYAPSAVVQAAALRRAARERPAYLVALADPEADSPLPAARPEVEEIAALFANADVAPGHRATATFLRERAGHATHLHLACHARGGLFDSADAALRLASGDLSPFELAKIVQLDTRLVVVSACESALSEIAGLPDEVVSIGSALLASGSACAIASLWPVDDLATALLMTQLYREMLVDGRRPPEALRRAQQWLRALSS